VGNPQAIERARRIAAAAAGIAGVAAISLGGSLASGLADERSDIDLHVYWRAPLADRAARAAALASLADPGTQVAEVGDWGLEDHLWAAGQPAELIYVNLDDLAAEVERAYGEGLGGEGFTTAQLTYVAEGVALHDPRGALAALQERLATYPEPTRRRVLASNPQLLRAYLGQLRKAQERSDLLFAQHRRYTIQMVFFNLLFALNRRYHPGEKRLLAHAERIPQRPGRLRERWEQIALIPIDDPAVADLLEELVEEVSRLAEGAP
jgi:hypothetical protein